MSDTPRTDAYARSNPTPERWEWIDKFEQFERELTAAKAEIARLKAGGCARDQRTTQFCGEALKLQEQNDRLRRALERLVKAEEARSFEDFTQEEMGAWANAKAALEDTQ